MSSRSFPIVAIIGRTNVGKSSLFNALLGYRSAIVEDFPGVTRDRNYALVKRFERPFTLVDTGGLLGEDENPLHDVVRAQAQAALSEADLIIGVLDAAHGTHALDPQVVRSIKASCKPVIWVANKCENKKNQLQAAELYELGIDDLCLVSAAHKLGIKELGDQICGELAKLPTKFSGVADNERDDSAQPIKIAVLGRPNVGKSTLLNTLIGQNRVVTSEIAGTTTDSIKAQFEYKGRQFILLDTAGLRKKARVDDGTVERYSNLRALRALAECDVAIMLVDASQGYSSEQDAKIAGLIHERGRAMIVAVNKWDLVEKNHRTVKDFERGLRTSLKFGSYAPMMFISALSGRRCSSLLDKALALYDGGAERIRTSDLNRILGHAVDRKAPPTYHAEPVKLFFATQTATRPPEIVLFFNHPTKVGQTYIRYLKNALREHFPCAGYDIKFQLRKRSERAERLREQHEGAE